MLRIFQFTRLSRGVTGLMLVAALLALGLFGAANPVLAAAGPCVNPGGTLGCLASINAAIAAASLGATVTIHAGTYAENVVVDKPLTL